MGVIVNLFEIFIVALGLSMDAFAAAICKGLALRSKDYGKMFKVGAYFGFFQGIMPVFGFILANAFAEKIQSFDHWIAFLLLGFIGFNMVKESRDTHIDVEKGFTFKAMLAISIATSIDAMAVGITFAFLKINIMTAALFIGITTFITSIIGVKIGNTFGVKYKQKAELFGGLVLIFMGIKILLEHLNILSI